ncbi:hypothetical protein D3C80_264760 [compost metagenome]
MRIDDDAVADDGHLARTNDAGRQERQLVAYAIDDERMAGIMTALVTHNDVGALREPVDNLALALITPLRTHYDTVRHICFLPFGRNPPDDAGLRPRSTASLTQVLFLEAGRSRPTAPQTRASIMPWREESDLFVTATRFLRDKGQNRTLFAKS